MRTAPSRSAGGDKRPGSAGTRPTTLGDVLRLRKEVVHPRDNPSGSTVFVGLEHIEPGTGRRTGQVPVQMERLTGRKPRFHKGDIVYGYLRPYLNKVWVAEFDGLCSVDQYVYGVADGESDPDYLAWFMRSPAFLARAPIDRAPGQLPRIRTEEVAAVPLTLPAPSEQRAIAARLAAQMATLSRARSASEERLAAASVLFGARLRQAFESGAVAESDRRALRDVCLPDVETCNPRSEAARAFRYIDISSVDNSRKLITEARSILGSAAPTRARQIVRARDVLVATTRPGLNAVALVPEELDGAVCSTGFCVLRAGPEIEPGFLFAWVQTRQFIDSLVDHGALYPGVRDDEVLSTEIPVPPPMIQKHLAETLAAQARVGERLRDAAQAELDALNSAPPRLLHRIFSQEAPDAG